MQDSPRDEEQQGLLKLIIEGQAYRQTMLCNIRGHGLKFLPGIEEKIAMTEVLDTSLRQFREVARMYEANGFGDVVSAVRGKLERIPYPGSRVELAMCLFLCERVQHLALAAYVDCADRDFAAIARTRLEAYQLLELPKDPILLEYCADETNRPQAQQFLNRWMSLAMLAMGRAGNARDLRAVELGLRARSMAEVAEDFVAGLAPFLEASGLTLPDAETLGIETSGAGEARAAGSEA